MTLPVNGVFSIVTFLSSRTPEQQMEQEINLLLQVYDSSVWEQRRQELKEQRRRKGNKK